jgi:hypothetical protein
MGRLQPSRSEVLPGGVGLGARAGGTTETRIWKRRSWSFCYIATIALLGVAGARDAQAVPSYARQTAMPCEACHAGGFYPELNNFGRMFKLNGYIWSAHEEQSYEPFPPVAAAQEWSYTYTQKSQPGITRRSGRLPTVGSATDGNNNFSYPQQANFFLAGRYYGRFGGYIMGTYSGVDNKWVTDNTDLRLTDVLTFGENHTLLYGATFNNGPTVQDAWNTLPAWSQLVGSEVAPGPAASTSIENLLSQVAGVGAYAFWDNFLYAEVTPYIAGNTGALSFVTAGNPKEAIIDDVAPYWRLVLYKNKGSHSLSLGGVGLYDKIFQAGSHGPSNTFLDLGSDVQYQWNSKPHFVSFRSAFIWENQDLSAAKAANAASNGHDDLHRVQLWASYYRYDLAGITLSFFDIGGRRDAGLYAPDPVDGSRTGRPDTTGGFVQLNFMPFSQWYRQFWPALPMTQFALQYTFYSRFNGDRHNYDGAGRSASDNNTLYLLLWTPW